MWHDISLWFWFALFLMISRVEHLFVYLLPICLPSLQKCLFGSFAHFQIGLCVFCYWVVRVPYVFWLLTLYQIHSLQIFSPIPQVAFLFCWLFPLLCRNFLVWYSPTYLFLLLLFVLLLYPKSHCQDQCQGAFLFVFSWKFYGFRSYV